MNDPGGASSKLRAAFIQAAREILEEPDTGLDLRKVAERAGKSRTAPYLVFGKTEEGGGLEALRLAVAVSGLEELVAAFGRALAGTNDPERALRRAGVAYLEFARTHPRLFRLMFGPEVARAMRRLGPLGDDRTGAPSDDARVLLGLRGVLEGGLREAIVACQRVSIMGPGDADERVLGAWAMFHGAAMLLLDGQLKVAGYGDSPTEAARIITGFLLEGAVLPVARAAAPLTEAKRRKEMLGDAPHEQGGTRPRTSPDDDLAFTRDVLAWSSALRRARRLGRVLAGSRVLWIDDHPDASRSEQEVLEGLGVLVVRATDTFGAMERLGQGGGAGAFDLIVSDIARGDDPSAGARDLPLVRAAAPGTPVVFYVGRLDRDAGPPTGAFGITDDPEELLHLVLDVLERRKG